MANKFFLIYIILTFLVTAKSNAQDSSSSAQHKSRYFISINSGIQMSGIKDEDFVSSNYSPLFNITAGKWFTPYLALQVGYKGFYFNYIEDDLQHHYNYFYGEAVVNMNNILQAKSTQKSWGLLLHLGAGYFYNHLYGRPNACVNIGVQNSFKITNQIQATFDISSIIGWDIYQGNKDILPGITVGAIYFFDIYGIIE
jgi:hypothetical protein